MERKGDQHEKAYNSSNVSFADGAEHVTSNAYAFIRNYRISYHSVLF